MSPVGVFPLARRPSFRSSCGVHGLPWFVAFLADMVHLLSGYVNSMNLDKYTTYGAIIASTGAGGEDALKVRSDKEVGARISGLLGERPQRELAEAIDMQPSVLSRALAGERAFNMSELVDIADYLGVHIEDLLFDAVSYTHL